MEEKKVAPFRITITCPCKEVFDVDPGNISVSANSDSDEYNGAYGYSEVSVTCPKCKTELYLVDDQWG